MTRSTFYTMILIVLAVLVLLLLLKSCDMAKENSRLLNQVSQYQLGQKAFDKKRLEDSSTIASQTQTILTQDEAIKLGLLKLDGEIKKVQSQVSQKQEVVVNEVEVPYIPNGFVDTSGWYSRLKSGEVSKELIDSLDENCVIVNTGFQKTDKWYSINGKVKKDGILVDSLKLTNESSVTVGYKKTGFLGLKSEPIVEIKNTNPYLSVTKMNNVVVHKKKGIFQKKLFWTGLGVLGGFYLRSKY